MQAREKHQRGEPRGAFRGIITAGVEEAEPWQRGRVVLQN